ncbi:hypothetical protein EXS56_01065 [Candidatus Kaiserbacteria bacterium]|nr:hypothetical protein [Candidatus Kaiserbacteria bacterium]
MAKDYFQDITPPSPDMSPPRQLKPLPPEPDEHVDLTSAQPDARDIPIRVADASADTSMDSASRGIRNISAPSRPRPVRLGGAPNGMDMDIREAPPMMGGMPPRPPRHSSRLWIWAAASVVILLIVGGLLFFFGSTVITVTPKSRTALLTSAAITAREGASAPAGTLSYTLQTFDLEDSEVVEAQGTTHVESKASGSITVSNTYSASPVKLVKNTRFESPDGLIFRVLSDVVVPGKKGSVAGTVSVTVVADQPGEKYNTGPTAKFTLPGLKSTPPMFAGISAKSGAAMTGGFAGDKPGTAPGALEAAVALVRGRLEVKAHEAAAGQAKDDMFVFPELMVITYQSLPTTNEAGSSVRVHEKAHMEIPVFPKDAFAMTVAKVAFTDSEDVPVSMEPLEDFSVHALAAGDGGEVGILNLVASGQALIFWKVDTAALTEALKGKDSSAFQGIVNGFSSILEAHARIAPFWKSSFPADASDIKVDVIKPAATK